MGHWDDIRRSARARRAEVLAEAGLSQRSAVVSCEALLAATEQATGVARYPLEASDPLLYGAEALLYTESGESAVYYCDEVAPWRAHFCQAHEFAHLWLHHAHTEDGDEVACTSDDVDVEAAETSLPVGVQRVEGYGPRERREREANVFAREYLLPTDALRDLYAGGLSPTQIALRVGLPPALVYHQLAHALLAPDLPAKEAPEGAAAHFPLDSSQRKAAYAERGPLLLEAGPGTGKTRTLTARVAHLLERGVAPTSILALTFSNRAAEEMRSRVAALAPDAASLIWMGTFHSFGLELLSKHGTHIGLPAKVNLVDPVDALLFLERSLNELRLEHYMNLYEPTMYLRDILSAVSRAKDELAGPEQYEELARGMLARAESEEDVVRAERALEVARVYAFYQAFLEHEGLVDFGDLIFHSVTLLRDHADVRERVRSDYTHVLVDEFQDVNRASGLLLRELAGEGEGLWAVGDARQAIYRFRGAAPSNMHLFTRDYPGASVLPLEVNYRSQPPIVETFAELAPQMKAAGAEAFAGWRAHRPNDGGEVRLEIADDLGSEARAVATLIEERHEAGVPYGEQAVLCRSHTTLARIGAALESRGVPVLYLGDLFERAEVRDILALLDLISNGEGAGLVRVARFPEYGIPQQDARAVLTAAREQEIPVTEAMSAALEGEGLSEQGRAGLALLLVHLEASAGDTAWKVLAKYLFSESAYLRGISGETHTDQQKRLALFQFLQFAHEQRGRGLGETNPVRHFLSYVRWLEIYGEERTLRQVPDWARGIDAVRMLTVHAAKGLEFSAVYLPGLGNGYFPARKHHAHCPPPDGLLEQTEAEWHEEEEECLFFVALSRARDTLCLSRARAYGKRNSLASPLLRKIATRLPVAVDGPSTWAGGERPEEPAPPRIPERKPAFNERLLQVYMDCPRQFYYEYQLGLGARGEEAAYVRFHRSVYRAIAYVRDEQEAGREVTPEGAIEELARIWEEQGMSGHVHEPIYYEQAREMLLRAIDKSAQVQGYRVKRPWEVPLDYGHVRFTPDQAELERDDSGEEVLRLQRLRTGRPSSSERDHPIYALYHKAGESAFPDAVRKVQALYLSTDQATDIELNEKQVASGLKTYNEALAGILSGDFHPKPDDRRCPRCAYYFICPEGDEGTRNK